MNRHRIFFLFFFVITLLLTISCNDNHKNRLSGNVFGTYYSIIYFGKENSKLTEEIDSIFAKVNNEFSTFDAHSLMSKINRNEVHILTTDQQYIFHLSQKIQKETSGAFDPTLLPLIQFWGFRDYQVERIDTVGLDSIMQYIGIEKIMIHDSLLVKENESINFNFDAIAKGYAVDLIAEFFEKRGYKNYVVDIGGEVITRGKNGKDAWKVGIQKPTQTADGPVESTYIFDSQDYAIATSGNYRNYVEIEGERFSHILNPANGFPERSNLLSVSVIAPDCATADAYATAFMVMGLEKSKAFVARHPELKAFFIYDEDGEFKTFSTSKF